MRDARSSEEALKADADTILLDNMTLDNIRKARALAGESVQLEVSGGVTTRTVRAIAEAGADLISVGALTHSATVSGYQHENRRGLIGGRRARPSLCLRRFNCNSCLRILTSSIERGVPGRIGWRIHYFERNRFHSGSGA